MELTLFHSTKVKRCVLVVSNKPCNWNIYIYL